MNGPDQLLRHTLLEQVGARTGAQHLVHEVLLGVNRQRDDPRAGCIGQDAPGGVDAVDVGHADVHDDHVRRECPGLLDGLPAITGLADHGDIRLALQQRAQPLAQQRVIVCQQHRGYRLFGP